MSPAPDLIEPVVGFRDWRIEDGRLASRHLPMLWDEPVVRAECFPTGGNAFAVDFDPEPHAAPGAACGCGIYAWHEPRGEFPLVDVRGVSGIVTVWGTLQVYEDGVRAEYAQVEALAIYERWTSAKKDAVAALATSLGADVVALDELAAAGADYGRPIPSQLVPAVPPADRRRLRLTSPRRARA